MNKKTIIRSATLMAILAFASGAAAKTLQPLLFAQSHAPGSTFTTCNGTSSIWAQSTGLDGNGNLVCFQRQYQNAQWGTVSCPATAALHSASLRSLGQSYCSSPWAAWPAVHPVTRSCAVNNLSMKVDGGACVSGGTVMAMSTASN